MDRELIRERCEAYVLGALDADERRSLEELIERRDPDCLVALGDARELAAQVAFTAPVLEPPPALRARLLDSIAEPAGAKVLPFAAARPRRGVQVWAGWAVAAALLAVAVYLGNNSASLERRLETARAEFNGLETKLRDLSVEAVRNRRVLSVLMSRDARTIRLATTAPGAPQFRAYWSEPAGLVLVGSDVVAPPQGRTLQLWVVPKRGGAPVSAGVFQPDAQGQVLLIAESTPARDDAAALAISEEPAGGSPQPTTQPSWVGAVSE